MVSDKGALIEVESPAELDQRESDGAAKECPNDELPHLLARQAQPDIGGDDATEEEGVLGGDDDEGVHLGSLRRVDDELPAGRRRSVETARPASAWCSTSLAIMLPARICCTAPVSPTQNPRHSRRACNSSADQGLRTRPLLDGGMQLLCALLELADAAAEGLPELRETLGSEEKKDDDEDDEDVDWLDGAHALTCPLKRVNPHIRVCCSHL